VYLVRESSPREPPLDKLPGVNELGMAVFCSRLSNMLGVPQCDEIQPDGAGPLGR